MYKKVPDWFYIRFFWFVLPFFHKEQLVRIRQDYLLFWGGIDVSHYKVWLSSRLFWTYWIKYKVDRKPFPEVDDLLWDRVLLLPTHIIILKISSTTLKLILIEQVVLLSNVTQNYKAGKQRLFHSFVQTIATWNRSTPKYGGQSP